MSVANEAPGAAPQSTWDEFLVYWKRLPDKPLFFVLLGAWAVLFHLWGTTQFNFSTTPSLFEWMYTAWGADAMDSEHAKLIPFVVLGLLWFKRDQLAQCAPGAGWIGLPLLFVALSFHAAGFLAQQPRLSMIGFFLGLYSLVGIVWGWRAMRATFFPMFLFGFCLPLGTVLDTHTLALRLVAAKATLVVARDWLDIPVIRDGTQLFNSDKTVYDVAAACSGIRSFVALTAITTIFAMLKFKTLWRRTLIILLTIPLALGCNVLRLVAIIVAERASGPKAADFIHEWFGYVTYAAALICLLLVDWCIREPAAKPPPPPSADPAYGSP